MFLQLAFVIYFYFFFINVINSHVLCIITEHESKGVFVQRLSVLKSPRSNFEAVLSDDHSVFWWHRVIGVKLTRKQHFPNINGYFFSLITSSVNRENTVSTVYFRDYFFDEIPMAIQSIWIRRGSFEMWTIVLLATTENNCCDDQKICISKQFTFFLKFLPLNDNELYCRLFYPTCRKLFVWSFHWGDNPSSLHHDCRWNRKK